MLLLQLNEATAAQRRIPFYAVDATDGFTPEDGLSSFTVDVSENGGARAAGAGADPTEVDGTNLPGHYYYECTQAELSTLGYLAISIKHANMRDFLAIAQVVAFDPYAPYSIHSAADVWSAGSRELSTPNNYKADVSNLDAAITTRAPANEYDTELDAVISSRAPANEYDTQLDQNLSTTESNIRGGTETLETTKTNINANETKIDAVKTDTAAILLDTDTIEADLTTEINANETKIDTLTTNVGNLNNISSSDVQTVLETNDLDHLIQVTAGAEKATVGSYLDKIMNKDGSQTFDPTADSLEAIRDRGDAEWVTGGAGGIDAIINVIPSIPTSIDVSDTKVIRLALYVIDSIDDLPTTAEITPGTITIDRSADGGTSWSTIVNAEACLEHAGCIYYDEVFNSGSGYASADMIRITFKGQKVTIATNDFEIADASNGMVFNTRMDSGLSGGGPSAGDIADAVWEEPIVDHSTGTTFGGKNQKVVPSETIADYKADVSALATEANVNDNETKIDAVKTDTAAILIDTDTLEADLKTHMDTKETNIIAEVDANEGKIDLIQVDTTAIDGKTTNLPVDPASETNVNANETKIDTLQTDLDNPDQYKANITALALEATVDALNNITGADVWAEAVKVITGGVLTTPNDYKADVSGLSVFDPSTTPVEILASGGTAGINAQELIDLNWDEPLTGATHNISTSSGRRLRSLGDTVLGSVSGGTPTNTTFLTDLTATTDNLYNSQYLKFIEGNLYGQVRIVQSYNGTTKEICICVGEPFSEAPADGDEFEIISVHIHPLLEVTGTVWEELRSEHNNVLTFGGKNQLGVPSETINDYKADVSSLALEATVQAIKTLTDNLPADTETEFNRLKALNGEWMKAEYNHDINNDNDILEMWFYDNETNWNTHNKSTGIVAHLKLTANYTNNLIDDVSIEVIS